jgi:integrase
MSLPIHELYRRYIEEMTTTWSEASVRSESQRLNVLWDVIDGDAPKLWDKLKADDYGRYSMVVLFTRVTCFWDWAIEGGFLAGPNPYKVFRKKNRRAFLNAYVRKPCEIPYAEAKAAIMRIEKEDLRNKALQLLSGGLRWSESYTLTGDGYVTGKGSKVRKVYAIPITGELAEKRRYSAMLRQLKKVGIQSPHKLRSIKMTSMVDKGANPFELKKFAGWSSLATAESYVNAKDDRIKAMAMADEEEPVS